MTSTESKPRSSELVRSILSDPAAREILDLLIVAGSVKDKRHLHALIFAAQELGAVEKHYTFGFSESERLAPISGELSYNMYTMEEIGAIVDTQDEHSVMVTSQYQELVKKSGQVTILKRDVLDELAGLARQNKLVTLSKFLALRKLLAPRMPESAIRERAREILMLSEEEMNNLAETIESLGNDFTRSH